MKKHSPITVWRLLAVLVMITAIVGIGGFRALTSGSATGANGWTAQKVAEFKASLRHGGMDIADASANRKGVEGPSSGADAFYTYQRAYPADTIPSGAFDNGVAQANLTGDGGFGAAWQQLGPLYSPGADRNNPLTGAATSISGRTTALAVDPNTCAGGRCQKIYIGTANGGIWKTTNAGASYVPLLDHQLNTAIGTLVLDPNNSNNIYAGTGEGNFSGDSNRGIGILHSTDGGTTWTTLGRDVLVNRGVTGLVVDNRAGFTAPHIYAGSTSGQAGGASTGGFGLGLGAQPRGFYYSTDGGQSFTKSNPVGINDARVTSLVMDPTDHNVLWAGFASWGVYKSTDDGLHWTQDPNLPTGNGNTAGAFFRINIAMAPSDHQNLYIAYDNNNASPNVENLYHTTNGGTSYTSLPVPNICQGQCSYDMPLAIDPTDPNTIYEGGQYSYSFEGNPDPSNPCYVAYPMAHDCGASIAKSSDGGQTWADVGRNNSNGPVHPDNHNIVIPATDRTAVYDGNDGGFYHSADGALNASTVTNMADMKWDDLNRGLGTTQFTGVSVGPTGAVFGGTQDNGTFRMFNGNTTSTHVNGGDGGVTGVDPVNANRAYYTYYGAQFFRDDNALQSPFTHVNQSTWIAPFWADYFIFGHGSFYEPYAVSTSAPNNIFWGTNRIWRTTSYGGYDGNNDGDATNDSSDTGYTWAPVTPQFPGFIASVAVSPNDPNSVVFGTSTGRIYVTHNALAAVTTSGNCDARTIGGNALTACNYVSGITWTRVDNTGTAQVLPNRYPTSIAFAPSSSTSFYISYSGYGVLTPSLPGHIYMTTDFGTSFTNLAGATAPGSAPLPDLPFNSIVVNTSGGLSNGHLYAAADYGVWVSLNNGKTWTRRDFGLPNTPVYALGMAAHGTQLYAATHGRGIWFTGAS